MHPRIAIPLVLFLTFISIIAPLIFSPKDNHSAHSITNTPVPDKTPLADSLSTFSDDIENRLIHFGIHNGTYRGLAWFYETCHINLCSYVPFDISIETTIDAEEHHACYEILLTTLAGKTVNDFDNPDNVTDKRIHYWIHQPQYYSSKLCFDIARSTSQPGPRP